MNPSESVLIGLKNGWISLAVVLNPSELVLNPSESVLVVPLRSAQEEYGQLAPDGEPAQVEDEVDKVHAETQHNTLR